MKQIILLAATVLLSSTCFAQAYKCKTANGGYEFSDQPCRSHAATARTIDREHISESQRRSSREWLQRGAQRLQQKEQEEAEAAIQARQRQEERRAAMQEQQRLQQDANERRQMAAEIERLRQQQAETAEAARRAEAASNAAAAAANNRRGGPINCFEKMSGRIVCN